MTTAERIAKELRRSAAEDAYPTLCCSQEALYEMAAWMPFPSKFCSMEACRTFFLLVAEAIESEDAQ